MLILEILVKSEAAINHGWKDEGSEKTDHRGDDRVLDGFRERLVDLRYVHIEIELLPRVEFV